MTETILRTDAVSKWFGEVIALNDVSFEISKGVTGLLGHNGAGKSTLLKLATGMIRPSRGRVELLGRNPWNNPHLMRRIGLAPEHDTFYDHMTGLEFVSLVGRLNGLRAGLARERAREVLAQVGLGDALTRRVGAYSKGMKQRAKLAQAIVGEPEILFLDEPLTGMDPVGRREMMSFIRAIAKQGTSVLVSSHVLHEVEAITSEVLLIAKGRIVAEGNVYQIRSLIDEHPHHVSIQSTHPRELAKELLDLPGVVRVAIDGQDHVTVETRQPDQFYTKVIEVLQRGKYRVTSMTSPDDNLQAVFRYLVG